MCSTSLTSFAGHANRCALGVPVSVTRWSPLASMNSNRTATLKAGLGQAASATAVRHAAGARQVLRGAAAGGQKNAAVALWRVHACTPTFQCSGRADARRLPQRWAIP